MILIHEEILQSSLYVTMDFYRGVSFLLFLAPDGPPENVYVMATSPFSINISWHEPAIITGPMFYLIDVKSVWSVLHFAKGSRKYG